jgi:hypothetical protein
MSAALVLRTLERLQHGRWKWPAGGERRAFGGGGRAPTSSAQPCAFSRILARGEIGFAGVPRGRLIHLGPAAPVDAAGREP